MHILSTTSGQITNGIEPVDPDHYPADLIFLSTADTDLAILSQASRHYSKDRDFIRLGQLSWLTHPYSVDLYLDKTAIKSKLVIIRALGGTSYWQYCLEQFSVQLKNKGVNFVVLPGDDKPDPELLSLSTLSKKHWENLFGYLLEGGPNNASFFLQYCRHLLYQEPVPPLPSTELKNGIYYPQMNHFGLEELQQNWHSEWPVAAIVFYRSLFINGNLEPVEKLISSLTAKKINSLPIFVSSLKDKVSVAFCEDLFQKSHPDIVLNLTGFALGAIGKGDDWQPTVLDKINKPVFQIVLGSADKPSWQGNSFGLPPRDIAMFVSLPEIDGRILSRAIAFKNQSKANCNTQYSVSLHEVVADRLEFVSELTRNWINIGKIKPENKKIAVILGNYPNKDGRLANGVGLDTPESATLILNKLKQSGYKISHFPETSSKLMNLLLQGTTNDLNKIKVNKNLARLSKDDYKRYFLELSPKVRSEILERWGHFEQDPYLVNSHFVLPLHKFGNIVVAIQPARGFNIDPKETYHSPDLVPPHNYFAFYFWIRKEFGAHAIVHLGKHGNLEWLPGKAMALSEDCFTEAALGPTPHFYPFIINDPGEGTQAKRRSQAVIIDHLTPPLTRAESYGMYRDLEILLDEYYEASGVDAKRTKFLENQILETVSKSKLEEDIGIDPPDHTANKLQKLDAYLCELKERQIRDGLHIFGKSPQGIQEHDLIASLLRTPRNNGEGPEASSLRSLAKDFGFGEAFDPLDCDFSLEWQDAKPAELREINSDPWRSNGDTVERLELYFSKLLESNTDAGKNSREVISYAKNTLKPLLRKCGGLETEGLLQSLNGKFLPPGPSGAPSRGRVDILPTGRNFYSVDSRSIPTRTAWTLGWKSANLIIERYLQDKGDWPRKMALTAWGTSNMRTGGDDIAQALSLMGVKPQWNENSGRVTGFEILPHTILGRPRVDVTLRVSGFFRDAFPTQIDLVANAAKAVMNLDEPEFYNPAAECYKQDIEKLGKTRAGFRVFGSMPRSYGAGLQALIDEQLWSNREDLGQAYLEWGSFPLGQDADGKKDLETFTARLGEIDTIVHNQDNYEHDILDSDDYYQFEGGISAAIEKIKGEQPTIFHNDHSRPERPVVRTLEEEIGRVVRSRSVNPKWINGVKRHGYKGAFEIAATVDYLFAFAATTGAAKSHHFDLTYTAYLEDKETRKFIEENNPDALKEIANRFLEAMERGFWCPKLNSTRNLLMEIVQFDSSKEMADEFE